MIPSAIVSKVRRKILFLAMIVFGLSPAFFARAFTSQDADTIFKSYNDAFYFTESGDGFYRANTDGGKTTFWTRAEQIEMVLDAYERSTNAAYLALYTNLFNGFVSEHGSDWQSNEYNDDIMWMVIASARGYLATHNPKYLGAAKNNFDPCFARAWSTNFGGGLWWKTSNQSKNACVNGPAAIAAALIYQSCGDTNYLAKAKMTFEWERDKLFDPANGKVFDHMNSDGDVGGKAFSYNEGTFIGAADLLGYTNEARLAADYVKKIVCWGEFLPGYGQSGDSAGFNGICVRWLAKFMKHRGLEADYLQWLQFNANAAWKNRRPSDNLSGAREFEKTSDRTLDSWACSDAVVILQVCPPGESGKNDANKDADKASR